MDFGLSDFQRELKTSARDFLKNECPTTFVRQAMASEDGVARELNSKIAELGWPGLTIPERFGGLGLGMLDLAMVLEECGYASMPGAFLFSTIAATVLRKSGDDQLCKKWLPDLAKGSALGTVALPNPA